LLSDGLMEIKSLIIYVYVYISVSVRIHIYTYLYLSLPRHTYICISCNFTSEEISAYVCYFKTNSTVRIFFSTYYYPVLICRRVV